MAAKERKPVLAYLLTLVIAFGCLMAAIIAGGLVIVSVISTIFFSALEPLDGDFSEALFYSHSPEKTHLLKVERVNPGATEPYYIRVSRVDESGERWVYNVRGQREAEVVWLSEDVAQINGVPVDVASGDYFTMNARAYIDAVVVIEAADVQTLQLTMYISGEPRASQTGPSIHDMTAADQQQVTIRLDALDELHWDDDLSALPAGMTCTITTINGQTLPLPFRWEWTAEEYDRCVFRLTGSAAEGYTLTPEHPCTVTPHTAQ